MAQLVKNQPAMQESACNARPGIDSWVGILNSISINKQGTVIGAGCIICARSHD